MNKYCWVFCIFIVLYSCSIQEDTSQKTNQIDHIRVLYELYFANEVFNDVGTYHKDSLMNIALQQILASEEVHDHDIELFWRNLKLSGPAYKQTLDSIKNIMEDLKSEPKQ